MMRLMLYVADAVASGGALRVQNNIPMATARHSDTSGQHFVKSAVVMNLPPTSITLEARIVHYQHIALMRAVDDDNVACV
jgi:hypothetical protein